MTTHPIKRLLVELGLSKWDGFEPYHDRVRDAEDIGVERCQLSGVLVLSRHGATDTAYYEAKNRDWSEMDRLGAMRTGRTDALRRIDQIRPLVTNRRWLDVGAGPGVELEMLSGECEYSAAVEPQNTARRELARAGINAYSSLGEVPDQTFDVATLFHVLEHIEDPVGLLSDVGRALGPKGTVVVEVPHARDFLFSQLDLPAFKNFSLWSEHLLLHTRESLTRVLKTAGFRDVSIAGVQRYPLPNQLYWLRHGLPNGHNEWAHLNSDELSIAWANCLARLDLTDTVSAVARWDPST